MAQSKNQIFGGVNDSGSSGKFSSPSVAQPPAIAYGAQGMRGRLFRVGNPRANVPSTNQISQSAVQSAFRRVK